VKEVLSRLFRRMSWTMLIAHTTPAAAFFGDHAHLGRGGVQGLSRHAAPD